MSKPTYDVRVDWGNDGSFDDPGDDVTGPVLCREPITVRRGRDIARGLSPPMAGSATLELDNRSGDYWLENAGSPLVGKILPGRRVRIRNTNFSRDFGEDDFGDGRFGGPKVSMFQGFLDEPSQNPALDSLSVGLPCLGVLSWLRGKTISTSLYQNIRTDQALGYILDAADWPAGERVMDTGGTTLSWWWADDEDAFAAAARVLNAEGPWAALYESVEGYVVFEGRHYRLFEPRSTAVQAILRAGASGDAEPLYRGLVYRPRLRDVINVCHLTVNKREEQALAMVWQLGETVVLGGGETRAYSAKCSAPFRDAVVPVEGVDYTVTVGSLGSVSLNRTSGQSCTITFVGGPVGCTLTGLQLRAKSIELISSFVVPNTIDTSASQTKYGPQRYSGEMWPEVPYLTAQDLANAMVAIYQEPKALVDATLRSANDDRFLQQLERDVSDRVRIISPTMGMDAEFFIEAVAHNARLAGVLDTTFGCEKVFDVEVSVWDVGFWDLAMWGF